MKHFELTKEILKKSKTYMPLATKVQLSKEIAKQCLIVDKISTNTNKFLSLPAIKNENYALKIVLLQNVLVGYYLDIEINEKDNFYELYDYYASGNLISQLEGFKTDIEVKSIAFDLLNDYKNFKKMVDTEIYNSKNIENDLLNRVLRGLTLIGADKIITKPEMLQQIKDEINKMIKELEVKKE